MSATKATEPDKPKSSDTEKAVAKQAEQQPAAKAENEKPDEGIRPDQLSSENDGGGDG